MDTQNVVKTPADSSKNYQKMFRYVGLAIIAVIVLAVVISVIGALMPEKFEISGKTYALPMMNDDGEYEIIFNGKKPVVVDEDISSEVETYSTDYNQKNVIFLTESGELYVVNSKGAKKAAEDVDSYKLSAFGDTILYINEDGDLYVGEIAKADKAKKIDSDVTAIDAVSPDGGAFAYTCASDDEKDEDEDEEKSSLNVKGDVYVSKNGKKGEKFDEKNSVILAISDDAKYVYYQKESGYYVNETKLADSEDSFTIGCFNRDGSQLIYSSVDEKSSDDEDDDKKSEAKTYMVIKGKEKLSLAKGSYSTLLAPSGAKMTRNSRTFVNTSSLKDTAVLIGENYYLIKNKKGDTEKLSELKNADDIVMLEDGKTVVFIKNETLKTYNVTKYKKNATEYDLDEDIKDFSCTVDGEHIYVRDLDNTLYYVKSEKKMTKIDDDVSSNYEAIKGGKVYYVSEDAELYYAKKSDSVKKVIGDEVLAIGYYAEANDVYTVTSDAIYSVNGKKAKKLINIDMSDW